MARQGDHLVAVGARGAIYISGDAAASWKQVASPVGTDLVTARFVDATTVWAVGHDGVALRSTDAGATWERVLDGRAVLVLLKDYYGDRAKGGDEEAQRILKDVDGAAAQSATPGVMPSPFFDVWFADANEGLLVGAFGLILHTVDGGKSWTPWVDRADNERRLHLYAVRGQGTERWVAGEQGLLLHWNAAAGRFAKVETPYNGTFFGVQLQPDSVVVHGLRGNVYVSRDSGLQWQKIETGLEANVVAALPLDSGRLLFVSQDGHMTASERDGASAVAVKSIAIASEVLDAVALSPDRVVLARSAGLTTVDLPRRAH